MTGRTARTRARRLAVAVAALLLVGAASACYTYSGARYGGPDAPLQARLAQTNGERSFVNFAVSDRAHVAVFRIHDSGYVRALYPYHPGSSSIFGSGAHTVLGSAPSFGHGWSPVSRFASHRRGFHARSSGFGRVTTSYLLMVASRQPLRMERIRDEVPFRYRPVSALATTFYRGTAFGTMDRLLARLVPEGLPREDWDVDWIVAADFGAPHRLRSPVWRIAAGPRPSDDDTTGGDARSRRLDGEDLPFNPPRIPVDLPEVASVDDPDGSTRLRVPLPPVDVAPEPRAAPDGPGDGPGAVEPERPRDEPAVEELGGPERERRLERVRRDDDAGAPSARGPSERFGRLFDAGDRREAEAWIPGGWSRRGRTADRRVRQWARELTEWASDPNRHEFPDPPRPPARWRGGNDGPGDRGSFRPRELDRPAGRTGAPGDRGNVRRIDPPTSPNRRDIEVRRPSPPDRGSGSSARESGSGSEKDRGGH